MSEFLKKSATRVRLLKKGYTSAPEKDSATFISHFSYFEMDTAGKTITELLLELYAKLESRYNCKKIIFGEAYGFSEFRFTPDYIQFQELSQYLLQLSCWLYRDVDFPDELWKALDEGPKLYE